MTSELDKEERKKSLKGASLVAVFRARDSKLLRYEDNSAQTVATVTRKGELKLTKHGRWLGFHLQKKSAFDSSPFAKTLTLGRDPVLPVFGLSPMKKR